MPPVIRRLLVLMLLVSLPIQGWAASRMGVAMAGMMMPTVAGAAAVHDHHRAVHEAGTPRTLAPADCCASHDAGHAAAHAAHASAHSSGNPSAHSSEHAGHAVDGGHASCGESCHCCISMALPAVTPLLKVQSPPADWQGAAACAFAQISAPTPDKPPKG